MRVLGGSLLQCIIPLGITLYFINKRELLSASFSTFWLGDNLINVSVYIKDASTMVLPLLGGDSSGHDWNWLLSVTHLLSYDQAIGNFIWSIGTLCLLLGIGELLFTIVKELTINHDTN